MNTPWFSPSRRWAVEVLALAVAYYVAARLARLLAIPPGYATAIWPAAGIALGGVLLFGRRVWPGVWLGSFLVNLGTTFDGGSLRAGSISSALALGIGLGATLQAVVGAGLVRRWVRIPNPLNREWDIVALLALGGSVSCLINATVGVLLLRWTGRLSESEYAFSWWTWWLGDTIGVFLVTPLFLLWGARSEADWPHRPLTVSVPLGITAGLVVALFVYVSDREQDRIRVAFEFQSDTMTRAVGNRLDHVLEAMRGFRGFQNGRTPVDRKRFAGLTRSTLDRRPALHCVSWEPRVTGADRDTFEEAARREGFRSFSIVEEASGRLIPAARRDEYFPVLYVEPLAGNEHALGFDVASNPDRLEALRRARDTGELAATAPVRLVQDAERESSILIFLPIYRDGVTPETVEQRRRELLGFVVAVSRIVDLAGLARKDSGIEGIDFRFRDVTGAEASADLAGGPMAASAVPPRTTTLEVAGRRWTLQFALMPEYLAAHRSMQAWSVLAGGMLFTGVMGAVLLVVTGRAALIAEVVKERTGELARANDELLKEITERLLVEDERDLFFYLSIDLCCLAGFDNFFKRINPAFTRTLGYTPDELLGVPFLDFVHPDDMASTLAEVERMAGGGATINFENRYRCKNGSYKWLQWNATPFRERQLIYASARDITDRKRMDRHLKDFNALLERRVSERTAALEQQSAELRILIDALSRSNQELDDFAYIASHDLKEPLRGIGNYAAFLMEDYSDKLDEAGRAKLETLQRLCGRMTELLDALLRFSRLGRSDLAVGDADLNAIVGQVLDSLQIMIQERGVTIRLPAALPNDRCDRARIGEVFRNLITNAIKYNDKPERWVEVGFQMPGVPGVPIVFHVRDNGIGIREKHLEAVFRIFKRLHGRDQFGGGTGAGLTIAKKIVERHGGRIWVESVFGEGTTFFFTLHGESTS